MQADDKTRDEIGELADTLRDNLGKIVQHGQRADSLSRTCCCIRVKGPANGDRSMSTPSSRRALTSPITALARRSKGSTSP